MTLPFVCELRVRLLLFCGNELFESNSFARLFCWVLFSLKVTTTSFRCCGNWWLESLFFVCSNTGKGICLGGLNFMELFWLHYNISIYFVSKYKRKPHFLGFFGVWAQFLWYRKRRILCIGFHFMWFFTLFVFINIINSYKN